MKINLQPLRKQAGFRSARAFAEQLNVPVATYTDWEQGRRIPSLETTWIIADALGEAMDRHVSIDELAGRDWPSIQEALSDEEREVLEAFRASDERGRGNIADTARREKSASTPDVVRLDRDVG